MSTQSQKGRKAYVLFSAFLLIVAIVLLAAQAIERSGPEYRIRSLMPTIRALAIDEPLDQAKLSHAVEISGRERPSTPPSGGVFCYAALQ